MDNMKVLDYLEAQVPWIVMADEGRQNALSQLAKDLVEDADKAVGATRKAISRALDTKASAPVVQSATDAFWARTEQPFRDALDAFAGQSGDADDNAVNAARKAVKEGWARRLRREGLAAFDEAVPPETLFALKPERQAPVVDARAKLLRALSRGLAKKKDKAA